MRSILHIMPFRRGSHRAGPGYALICVLMPGSAAVAAEPRSTTHWSFQSLRNVAVPRVDDPEWPRTEIDRFILAPNLAVGIGVGKAVPAGEKLQRTASVVPLGDRHGIFTDADLKRLSVDLIVDSFGDGSFRVEPANAVRYDAEADFQFWLPVVGFAHCSSKVRWQFHRNPWERPDHQPSKKCRV